MSESRNSNREGANIEQSGGTRTHFFMVVVMVMIMVMVPFLQMVRRQAEVSAGDGRLGKIIVGGQVSSAAHAKRFFG